MSHGGAIGSGAMRNGVSVAGLCRKHGVGDATVDEWKASHGGMGVGEAKRPKERGDENARLKWLPADAMPYNAALTDLLGTKWLRPTRSGKRSRIR